MHTITHIECYLDNPVDRGTKIVNQVGKAKDIPQDEIDGNSQVTYSLQAPGIITLIAIY